jgi:hypothetical protein
MGSFMDEVFFHPVVFNFGLNGLGHRGIIPEK